MWVQCAAEINRLIKFTSDQGTSVKLQQNLQTEFTDACVLVFRDLF